MDTVERNSVTGIRLPLFVVICYFGALLAFSSWSAAFDFSVERRRLIAWEQKLRTNSEQLDENRLLRSFTDFYFSYTLLEYPEFATTIGHAKGNDRWTDTSLDAIARRREDVIRFRDLIRSINRHKLNTSELINYDLLRRNLDDSVRGQPFKGEYLAITQLDGIHHSVPDIIAMMPTGSVKQYEDILSRLSSTPTLIQNSIELLKQGVKYGITAPSVTLREVPNQVKNLIVGEPLKGPLLKPFTSFPAAIPEPDQRRLKNKAVKAFRDQVRPAFQKLHDFLKNDYIPAARQSISIRELPNGRAWYAYRVRISTTTHMTSLAIHKLGLAEVKRIRAEMEKTIAETGFEGSYTEFNRYLRTDPRFYFDDADDLLFTYRALAKRADSQLGKLFSRLPTSGFEVLPVPIFAEKSKPIAYYQQGSLEAGRPGYFFVNTYDLKSSPKWGMEALTLHEVVPGHHLQISLQQELGDLPWFRRYGGYTAYMEGWGLYAESLGYDMGFYQDLYSRYGQLSYEMWRALRLVVDTGIHALGWSRSQAIEYFKANSGKSDHEIEVEVDRYITWPAQALAYKIGELKIKQLRQEAKKGLGERFDIRAFHDEILGGGAVPLYMLQTRIDEWLKAGG